MNIAPEQWLWLRLLREHGVEPRIARTEWTIYEVLDAHEALDLSTYAERLAHREATKKRGRR